MILLTKKEKKMHNKQKVCHTCKKKMGLMITIENIIRLETIVIIPENTEMLLMISEI